jgi:hypothetical protein
VIPIDYGKMTAEQVYMLGIVAPGLVPNGSAVIPYFIIRICADAWLETTYRS